MPYGIHWFRRDLRVAGNPALSANWKETKGRVLGLFVFDSAFLARPDFSANRFAFFLETLKQLRVELRQLGSDLLVMDVGYAEAFPRLFAALETPPHFFSYNRDYEPFARTRDTGAKAAEKPSCLIILNYNYFTQHSPSAYRYAARQC